MEVETDPCKLITNCFYICNMLITVGIAAYNVGPFIEKSVLSVLNQDYPDLDVLVIDDNSKDNTYHIVETLSKTHPRGGCIRIIRNTPNKGTAVVRNQCIDEAKGSYLLFLDGDDYITPNAISVLFKKAAETQAEMVIGAHCQFIEIAGREKTSNLIRYKPEIIKGDYALGQLLKENNTDYYPIALWNKLFSVVFLRSNNIRCIPAHYIWEDIYFAFQTSRKLKSIAVVQDVTMCWRMREGSAIRSSVPKERMKAYLCIYDQIISEIAQEKARCADHQLPVELYYILSQRFLDGFITKDVMASDLLSGKDKRQYLKQISSITNIGLKASDLKRRESKLVFYSLKSTFRYLLIKLIFFCFPIIHKLF